MHDTATTEIYTLSLHDALPILAETGRRMMRDRSVGFLPRRGCIPKPRVSAAPPWETHARSGRCSFPRVRSQSLATLRSEEHTSELQSQSNLVCRLLLEKKTP